jgi:hypothetical protein
MGKYLKLGADAAAEAWRLPDHADVDAIRSALERGMEEERAVRIPVVVGKDRTADLIVNAGELAAALVWEDVPAGAGITIID